MDVIHGVSLEVGWSSEPVGWGCSYLFRSAIHSFNSWSVGWLVHQNVKREIVSKNLLLMTFSFLSVPFFKQSLNYRVSNSPRIWLELTIRFVMLSFLVFSCSLFVGLSVFPLIIFSCIIALNWLNIKCMFNMTQGLFWFASGIAGTTVVLDLKADYRVSKLAKGTDQQQMYKFFLRKTKRTFKFKWGADVSYDLFQDCEAVGESLGFLLICIVPQRLQESVKEGNLDPREQSVAMEAQVPSLLSSLVYVWFPVGCLHPCSAFPTEERLPQWNPRMWDGCFEVCPVLQQNAGWVTCQRFMKHTDEKNILQ